MLSSYLLKTLPVLNGGSIYTSLTPAGVLFGVIGNFPKRV